MNSSFSWGFSDITTEAAALLAECSDLPLEKPLRVASFTLESARTVLLTLSASGIVAYGEAAPLARYGDNVEDILAFYRTFTLPPDAQLFARDHLTAGIPRAARCAIDVALYDFAGRTLGVSVTDLLGLGGLQRPPTARTVSIDEPDVVLADVRALRDTPVLKIKIGGASNAAAIDLVAAIRSIYTGAIRLDANEGWTPEQTVEILNAIARYDIEFCEQPIPAGAPEQIGWISERSKVPIMIDEDALVASQLGAFRGRAYAVNVKLAKCGGITAAYRMIATARALGLKVMIGCMAETRVLATAGAHLGGLADWLDIDGPLLLKRDAFHGVEFDLGRIIMPEGPGLGVAPVARAVA